MALPSMLASIVGWLRAGYPEGVPEHEYIPLVALLYRQQLSDSDVSEIADDLADIGDPASAQSIRDAIVAITNQKPLDADIARVSARLAAGGWPLARPDGA